MDLQNLMPQQSHPISRITNGQLPAELAELSEENLCQENSLMTGGSFNLSVLPASHILGYANGCSYNGDDEE